MRFSERLQTLMNVYRLNNAALAKGVGVDPSLVSRWRSGDRVPKRTSSVPADIAAFLSGTGMLQHDRETLLALMGVPCDTRAGMQAALQAWLQGQTPAFTVNMDPESPLLVADLFGQLTGAFQAEARKPSRPISLYPQVKTGAISSHETFQGQGGLRQGVINFLHLVLTNRTPCDIYLMPPADDGWLTGDPNFETLYNNGLRAVIQAGHTIHMVHPALYGSDLAPLLSTYMPLYSTGHFNSYGRAAAPTTIGTPAIFVSHGHAAVISYTLPGECVTTLYRSPGDVALYESIVHANMVDSRPLATACVREAPLSLTELLIQLEDRSGALFAVKNTLDAIFLPETLLYQLLAEQLPPAKVDTHLDMLARRREVLLTQMETQPWSILLPDSVIDAILINGTCRLSGIELLTPYDVTLSQDQLCQYLTNIVSLLERYPLLQVLFVEDCPSINVTVKEGGGTFFMADSVDAQPAAVYVGDLTLCEALYRWFTARIREAAPEGREQTLEQLQEAISFLG